MLEEKLTNEVFRDFLLGMLIKNITTVVILSLFLLGCETAFLRPERIDTEPVKVSGTTYKTYALVYSTDKNYDNPDNDPKAQREVYAIVGPGVKVHCGSSTAGCERAIRNFNNNGPDSEM